MEFLPALAKGAWSLLKRGASWIGNKVFGTDVGRTAVNAGIGYYNAKKQRQLQERTNKENFDFQREFAQNGVQWRVDDAKKAGISPLYGLGASLGSGIPSAQAGDSPNIPKLSKLPKKYRIAMESLQLEAAKLDNEVKRATILEIQSQAKRNEADIVFQQKQLSDLVNERSKITGAGKPRTISPFGYDFELPPGSSAQQIGDEFGDVAEALYGLGRIGQTAVHNANKMIIEAPIYRGSRDHRSTRPSHEKVILY